MIVQIDNGGTQPKSAQPRFPTPLLDPQLNTMPGYVWRSVARPLDHRVRMIVLVLLGHKL